MKELRCQFHDTELKYRSVIVGPITDAWYCDDCRTFYAIGKDEVFGMLSYDNCPVHALDSEQTETARELLASDTYRREQTEKKKSSVLCVDCGKWFFYSIEAQNSCVQQFGPQPVRCEQCQIKRRKEENRNKYAGVRNAMKRSLSRRVDSNGRVVVRSGGDFFHTDRTSSDK